MATFSAASRGGPKTWRVHGVTGWLALTASPSFALMAWVAANSGRANTLCSTGSSILPIDDMTAMYLLMSLFHLSPWLRLAFGRPWARIQPIIKGD